VASYSVAESICLDISNRTTLGTEKAQAEEENGQEDYGKFSADEEGSVIQGWDGRFHGKHRCTVEDFCCDQGLELNGQDCPSNSQGF